MSCGIFTENQTEMNWKFRSQANIIFTLAVELRQQKILQTGCESAAVTTTKLQVVPCVHLEPDRTETRTLRHHQPCSGLYAAAISRSSQDHYVRVLYNVHHTVPLYI